MTIKTPFKCYWSHERKVYNVVGQNDTTYGILSSKGNLHLYDKNKLHDLIMAGIVVLVGQPLTQPMVTITEEEYHSLIEEINMLQELIAELSSVDTAREQQAETYQELQKLLTNHHSFQDANGESTTHAQELCDTVLVLQAAYDRVYD